MEQKKVITKPKTKALNKALVTSSADTVTIKSMYFYSDWTNEIKHEIVLKDIIGFKLHWRGDGWHIEVVTKEKQDEYKFRSYELSHFVYPKQIAELIADKRCKIMSFINYHNSDNFIEHLNKVLDWSKTIT
jgi:hypothetical protein